MLLSIFPSFQYSFSVSLIFFNSLINNKSIVVGFYSILTSLIQFVGYGLGFVKSNIILLSSNKDIEDKFGVTAAVPVAAAAGVAGGDAAGEAAEKSDFNVVLTAAGQSKIAVIKVVKLRPNLQN